jgi:hypothetical protein
LKRIFPPKPLNGIRCKKNVVYNLKICMTDYVCSPISERGGYRTWVAKFVVRGIIYSEFTCLAIGYER